MMHPGKSVTVVAMLLVTLTPAQSPTKSCSKPPSGVAKMVRDVDITTLDMVPLEMTNHNDFKNPVIQFACNQNRTRRSPRGTFYDLPDQVWHMTLVPGGWSSAYTKWFKSRTEVRKWMNANVGLSGFLSKFSFPASTSYNRLQYSIHSTDKLVEDVSAFESANRVDFHPKLVLSLDHFAQRDLEQKVSGTFETNRASYNNFIGDFGTNYFSVGRFGGYIRTYMETGKRYAHCGTQSEVEANAKATYMQIISLHGGTVSGSSEVYEIFKAATVAETNYYGGETNLLKSDGIQRWQPTVDSDPWLFSGQFKSIYQLIADQSKQDSMRKAVIEYMMRSFLEELSRALADVPVRLPHF